MSPLSLPLPPLIAEVGPSDQPFLLYITVAGVIALAVFVRNIIGAVKDWQELRRHNAGGDFATREQLREVHGRVDQLMMDYGKMRGEITASISAIGDKFADSLRDVADQMSGIQRSLGRVEGLEKIITEHGADIDALQGRPARHAR